MSEVHIAVASLNQTPLDWKNNYKNCLEAISHAEGIGVEILVLPELCLSGYGCEDMFFAPWVLQSSVELLSDLARSVGNVITFVGLPFKYQSVTYNCLACLQNGKVLGIIPKQHLANDGIHYESRWFSPWRGGYGECEFEGEKIPFGSLLFDYKGTRIGVEICEDAWVKERPAIGAIAHGAGLIICSSASHFALSKLPQRIKTATDLSAIKSGIVYAYSNLLGNEAGRAIYDGSSFITKGNEMLASVPRFSFQDYELVSKIIDVDAINCIDTSSVQTSKILKLDFNPSSLVPSKETGCRGSSFEDSLSLKEEEFTRAVSLGMFDYLRKSKNKGFIVSLSGGADSSACAYLASLAFRLSIEALGEGVVEQKLGIKVKKNDLSDLITCAYLKTRNNSKETEDAARSVAEGINARFHVFEVDDIIGIYQDEVQGFLGRSLSWEEDGISLQNIQARARGPLVWFLANLSNSLLLSTSNRSEAAVGYTTMDGDTCGGLSPIGGIDKAFLLSWLRWLLDNTKHEFGDTSYLEKVTQLSPSAELKPLKDEQTDEKDLMPYKVLDVIERGFVKDKLSYIGLCDLVKDRGLSSDEEEIRSWVTRFLKLWGANQWKRERYAPSFHLDEQSLDPKTWCRFPILSGSLIEGL